VPSVEKFAVQAHNAQATCVRCETVDEWLVL